MANRARLLDAVKVVGAGNSIFLDRPYADHTYQTTFVDANASVTVVNVKLQGSLDGRGVTDANANWFDLSDNTFSAAELTAKASMIHITNKPAVRIRANLVTITGADGTNDTFSVIYSHGVK